MKKTADTGMGTDTTTCTKPRKPIERGSRRTFKDLETKYDVTWTDHSMMLHGQIIV